MVDPKTIKMPNQDKLKEGEKLPVKFGDVRIWCSHGSIWYGVLSYDPYDMRF